MKLAALALAAASGSAVVVALFVGRPSPPPAGLGAAIGIAPNQDPPPRRDPPADDVDRLLQAYDDVFNDLAMLNDGRFGLSRVPNNPMDYHPGLRTSNGGARVSEEDAKNPIYLARVKMQGSGVAWNEGVVSMHLPWLSYDIADWRSHMASGGRGGAKIPQHENWFALWRAYDPKNKLFPSYYRSGGAAPRAMMDLGVELRAWAADYDARKTPFKKRIGEWELRAKAVPYRHIQCTSCHPNAKPGEPAAVAVVAVHDPGGG